jgi:restriction system protein
MLPVLRDLATGERAGQETLDSLAAKFGLTPEELAELLPSKRQSKFVNRIAWAKAHMKSARLIESPKRGIYRITERGRNVLAENPAAINISYLNRYPEYVAFRGGSGAGGEASPAQMVATTSSSVESRTPDDLIEDGYRQHRAALAAELRERVSAMPWSAFEALVVKLLQAMNYGGPQDDAGLVVGKSGDEGIDGIIKQDQLGLETIYIQAKRWQAVVGRPEIQRFAGALQGQRAKKGVFITTSSFTREALAYPSSIPTTIILVDGARLAELMIDHGVAVTEVKEYRIHRVDSDYFTVD